MADVQNVSAEMAILAALGFDGRKDVKSLTLSMDNKGAKLDVTFLVAAPELHAMAEVLKRYDLNEVR